MSTYTKIETIEVGSGGASTIDFTSIPATYTDLVLKWSLRGNGGATIRSVQMQINNNTSSIYRELIIDGNGSSASSASTGANDRIYWFGWANDTNSTGNAFSNCEAYIPNYTGSNYKTMSVDGVAENNATTAYGRLTAILIETTSAISSIKIIGETAFLQYSSATLYGIKKN